MRVGVVFPQTEIGNDPAVIRDFAQAAESLGYAHLFTFDHVLGADPNRAEGWNGFYESTDAFHEPFVLFAYLAGLTTTLEFATGVLILPQRQTALVAKQAAEVDILSGGRLRLGIGTGWNTVEYEALGQDFHTRGLREAEQVTLMRRLWSEETIDFKGRWDRVDRAGINPRPSRNIPIWFGGNDDRVMRRAARLGDGWMPGGASLETGVATMHAYLRAEGRDPASFGLDRGISYKDTPGQWGAAIEHWAAMGGTHMSMNIMTAGLSTPAAQIDALRRFREESGFASTV